MCTMLNDVHTAEDRYCLRTINQNPQTNTLQTTTNKREHKKNKRQNWQGKTVMILTVSHCYRHVLLQNRLFQGLNNNSNNNSNMFFVTSRKYTHRKQVYTRSTKLICWKMKMLHCLIWWIRGTYFWLITDIKSQTWKTKWDSIL